MITNIAFLNEMGFTNNQLEIYTFLLTHKFGTINDIKNALNYSYSQVHHNLSILEEKNLIESSSDSNPKIFFPLNPKISLNELVNEKFTKIKENIQKLDNEIKVLTSEEGICTKPQFYHYSDINLGIENFYKMIENANKEIIMTALPPSHLKKLEPGFYDAFKRGIKLELYFSNRDFYDNMNYLEKITSIFKRVGLTIIETKFKTCQTVWFNNKQVNMGNILIDEYFLNSVVFQDDHIFHIDGFPGASFVKQAKGYLVNNEVIKRMEMEYPETIRNVIGVIKEMDSIKTRDISARSRTGGGKLKQILEFLVKEGKLKETIVHEGVGRPATYYSLSE